MADIYANITTVTPGVQEQIAAILELRAADPQQRAMREAYWSVIGFPKNARVLEVGCGPGPVTCALAEWPNVGDVVGLDPSSVFLARARKLTASMPNLSFVEGDARQLLFENAWFDVVILHTTLCHVPEPERALTEARRVLRDDGWLAIFDGDYATTTVGTGAADPLQSCADAWVASSVHDPWLMRRVPEMARAAGFAEGQLRSHGYVEAPSGGYMLTIIERGIAALLARRQIGDATADALRAEARRRWRRGVSSATSRMPASSFKPPRSGSRPEFSRRVPYLFDAGAVRNRRVTPTGSEAVGGVELTPETDPG